MDGPLGARYQMIAIDLPGQEGVRSVQRSAQGRTIASHADCVVQILEAFDIDHAVFFGWSLGGHVALEMMDRFPGTTGVMISGTAPVGRTPAAIRAGFRDPAVGGAVIAPGAFTPVPVPTVPGRRTEPVQHPIDAAIRILFDQLTDASISDQKRLVETSGVPLAIVNGADDPIVDIDYLTSLNYAKLWSKRCYIIPRTGHMPFVEQPDVFNDILKEFLRRMEGRLRAQLNHASLCFSG